METETETAFVTAVLETAFVAELETAWTADDGETLAKAVYGLAADMQIAGFRSDGWNAIGWMEEHFRDTCCRTDKVIRELLTVIRDHYNLLGAYIRAHDADGQEEVREAVGHMTRALEHFRAGAEPSPW